MEKVFEFTLMLESIAPIILAIAAIASAFAVFKANEIANAVERFQKNSVLNQREIELIGKALEKLCIYSVWCKLGGAGENVNYHDSNEVEYDSRGDATLQIPRDVKYIVIQLSAHSDTLQKKLEQWESGFITKLGNDYCFQEGLIQSKISELRSIRSDGL
jgi:hypothetical protein